MSAVHNSSATVSSVLDPQLDSDLLAHRHSALGVDMLEVPTETPQPVHQVTTFIDMLTDLHTISSTIECVEKQVRARRQQRRSVRAITGANAATGKSSARSRRVSLPSERVGAARPAAKTRNKTNSSGAKVSGAKTSAKNSGANAKRKKDDDALDCIYAELQDSAGMCRYWGKKCWNLRVAKPKGGFHSLCHFHRAKANDNQRRFDLKRRGTLWREFQPDPNSEDISLFPAVPGERFASVEAEAQSRPETAALFEPFERPVALQDQDVELLQELIGAATICEF